MDKEQNERKSDKPTRYMDDFVKEAEELCEDQGLTDGGLAAHFHVCPRTIYDWKRRYPEFAIAIQRGKDAFDSRVVESKLLKRACGYEVTETTRELLNREASFEASDHDSVLTVTKTVEKHVAPDVGAITLWLKNRNPKRWREVLHHVIEEDEPLTPEQAEQLLKEMRHAGDGLAVE